MRTVVLIKQVPDTYGERAMDVTAGTVDRDASELVIDEINARALGAAIDLREVHGGELIALSMGNAAASDALRKALAIGADRAIHILDDEFAGADTVLTSALIARALRDLEPDLIVAGNESTDGGSAAVPAMLAERLGFAQLTFLRSIAIEDDHVIGERILDHGYLVAEAALPAVVSVTEQITEPRIPNFKGIMSAKRKPFEILDSSALAISDSLASWSVVLETAERPPRGAGVVIVDEGDAGERIAQFLAESELI